MSRPDPHPRTAAPRLAAADLVLGYGGAPIVDRLDLAVPERAFTVLLGPNGSGKSTLLRALAGLLRPKAGTVLLGGEPLAAMPARRIARSIGVLTQGPRAPEGLTVRELVAQGRYTHRPLFGGWTAADEAGVAEALQLTGMEDLAERPLDDLSGGQRQRAWIAMALAQETEVLLLDEPTTFLDLAHQLEILDLVADLVRERGKTVIAVLHDLNQAARYADHMVLLAGGRIVVAGDPATVMTAETIADVFGVAVQIIADPVTGAPMCVPLARAASRRTAGPAQRSGG